MHVHRLSLSEETGEIARLQILDSNGQPIELRLYSLYPYAFQLMNEAPSTQRLVIDPDELRQVADALEENFPKISEQIKQHGIFASAHSHSDQDWHFPEEPTAPFLSLWTSEQRSQALSDLQVIENQINRSRIGVRKLHFAISPTGRVQVDQAQESTSKKSNLDNLIKLREILKGQEE